ncbi:exported protein [Achromobacter denitrificans]|uniref:Bug family tripartite tricarboxylate transporter substrate binding protein n=1 Tax=Achromobacter denitrificans TaxID=32002 RepID=UPI001663572C|nr:tripartite tricarboxylate transporter substrate binding protein [Achromobacter denitrificans]GFN26296.1 exported protein [Achromobacter denitrificans]
MKTNRVLQHLAASLALAAGLSGGAQAQDYPSRPVTTIVPFAAGGASDLLARQLGKQLSTKLGQAFVIENRAGAGGTVGARLAARAAPDGYTLVMGTNASHAIATTTHRNLNYDPLKDFAAISLVARVPQVVMVHPSVPVKDIPGLIDYAKLNPGQLNFSSAGNGTPGHLGMELFKMMTGVDMVHVPFQGGNPALVALTGGQVQLLADNISSALPQIKAGKARAIAVTSAHRSQALPDVPTIAEQGVTGFESGSWFALFAPAGTPPAVIDKLNAEVALALKDPAAHETLSAQGAEPDPGTPEALRQLIREDVAKWGDVVKRIGLQVD